MRLSKEVQVGLLAVVALATFYVGFKYLKGINVFRSTNRYFVVYDNVDNLQPSHPVLVQGLTVGRVADIKIQYGEQTNMLVGIDVPKDLNVNENTVAKLGDTGMFGTRAIVLDLNDGDRLESGARLKSAKAPGMVDLVTERFDQQIAPTLATFDTTGALLNQILVKNQEKLGELLTNANNLTANMNAAVVENRQAIKRITENSAALTDSLKAMKPRMDALMANFNTLADTVKAMELAHTAAKARVMLDTLNAVMAGIQAGEGTVGMMLKSDSLYDNLNTAMLSLDTVLTDFYEYPSRYVHFSVFGKSDEKLKEKAEKKKAKEERKKNK